MMGVLSRFHVSKLWRGKLFMHESKLCSVCINCTVGQPPLPPSGVSSKTLSSIHMQMFAVAILKLICLHVCFVVYSLATQMLWFGLILLITDEYKCIKMATLTVKQHLFFFSSGKKAKLKVQTRLYINKSLCYLMLELIQGISNVKYSKGSWGVLDRDTKIKQSPERRVLASPLLPSYPRMRCSCLSFSSGLDHMPNYRGVPANLPFPLSSNL